jgi:hypothetical protein
MAGRARALSEHLRSALLLAQVDAYPSSFALLRVALEHQLLDELIFHGRQHLQVYEGVTPAMWQEWQRARSEGADWTNDIIDWHWTAKRGGTVRVTRKGLYSEPDEDGHRLTMSVYYFLLQQFDPLCPPRSEAETPFQGLPLKPEQAAQLADHNKALYDTYLRWSSIRASLLGGGFFDSEAMSHLNVHYRFLSAYIHPLTDRTAATYGRNADWPAYDHYASELVLLYVITLAVREIRSFKKVCETEPVVALVDSDLLAADCDQLDALASHLWFPGQPPHAYDWFESHNQADIQARRARQAAPVVPGRPVYYTDPLRRLVSMHASINEMSTGRLYRSPWERPEARWR